MLTVFGVVAISRVLIYIGTKEDRIPWVDILNQINSFRKKDFLVVQWLRHCASTAGGHRFDPWSGS